MRASITRLFVHLLVERPARRRGPARLADDLEGSLAALESRLATSNSPSAREALRHIVGMERWGQRRLLVALGDAAFVRDEHHPSKPGADVEPSALVGELRTTRAATVALGRRVAAEGKGEVQVEHNSVGPLTAAGWLRYLKLHGDFEARRVR